MPLVLLDLIPNVILITWLSRCPDISTVGDNVGVADDSPTVLTQCREQAETVMEQDKHTSWIAAVVVVAYLVAVGIFSGCLARAYTLTNLNVYCSVHFVMITDINEHSLSIISKVEQYPLIVFDTKTPQIFKLS